MLKIFFLLVSTTLFLCEIQCQDVFGCGGFIKSDVEINFSLIEVKLLTKQGALKYQTDCAPINGYYMIPVYDKGEYSLVVEPPPGWSFEPQRVDVAIDGSTDKCSKGEDINFHFKGFGITGRVVSLGEKTGPAGIALDLRALGNNDVIKSTHSQADGSYLFSQVLPGDYTVTASHASWLLEPSVASVTVAKETGHAGASITVVGYDVKGHVMSEGEPTVGVKLLLYSSDLKKITNKGCDSSGVDKLPLHNGLKPLCHTLSTKTGEFVFAALPNAHYTVVPIYHGDNIKFDLRPQHITFKVEHNSVKLKQDFQVAGFSVSGRVVVTSKGAGVGGAKVKVNDRQVVTSQNGDFILETMKAGTYKVQVTAEGMSFDPVTVKITPNTPQLPEIVASRFAVCGTLKIDKFPERVSTDLSQRKINVVNKKDRSNTQVLAVSGEGTFCADLVPGVYLFRADVTAHEIHAGLVLLPNQQEVTVTHQALHNVHFRQLRVQVSGTISCVEKCKAVQLALASVDRTEERMLAQATVGGAKAAAFTFSNVMPGKYKVSLLNEDWCWKEKSVQITVGEKDVTDIKFVHNGYVLSCSLSHDVTLTFAHDSSKEKIAGSFDMKKGVSKFCLEKPGVYTLIPQSCHQFEQEAYKFDTSNPSILTLDAVKHLVEGKIVSEIPEKDMKIHIQSSLAPEELVIKATQKTKDEAVKPADEKKNKKDASKDKVVDQAKDEANAAKGVTEYEFSYWARAGETIKVSASSAVLLFYPESKTITIDGQACPGLAVQMEGKKGVFIKGHVTPEIAGVEMSITGGDMAQIDTTTDSKGAFMVGPLHPGVDYSVTAVKEGYVLTPVQGKLGHFTALKLGQISIHVVDEENKPLQGVLLSVSGIDYRSNVVTSSEGSMLVNSLTPGQYFVKPMMKEYVFEPASQTLSVAQGDTVNLAVKGRRVAYSCHGSVTSLNGEQEQGVVVEAIGQGDCADRQEEAKTEADGTFHIRGLQPQCDYHVQLKPDFNTHIERSAPAFVPVKVTASDYSGVRIIAFRRMSRLDLSGNVKASRDFLQYLKVSVYKESAPDAPLQTISLGQSPFFHLPSLTIDNQAYFVKLESTLSKSMYDYELPEISFIANKTFQHFTLNFNPVRKSLEQELSQSSFLIVPFTLLLVFLGYNYKQILAYLSQSSQVLYQAYQSVPAGGGKSSSSGADSSAAHAQQHNKDMQLLAELAQIKKRKPKKA